MKGYTEAVPGLTSPGTPSKKTDLWSIQVHREAKGGARRAGRSNRPWGPSGLNCLHCQAPAVPTPLPGQSTDASLLCFRQNSAWALLGGHIANPEDSHLDLQPSGKTGDGIDGTTEPRLFLKTEEVL